MTCTNEDTSSAESTNAFSSLLPLLTSGSDSRFWDALQLLLNASMLLERQQHLGVEPHERSEERNGRANGFKDRQLQTRLGELSLRVPQVRDSDETFYPQSLEHLHGLPCERGLRSECKRACTRGRSRSLWQKCMFRASVRGKWR